MQITKRQITMMDPAGFDEVFSRTRLEYPTDKAAFQALNEQYEEAFGQKRYASWNSYKVTRWKRISKKVSIAN